MKVDTEVLAVLSRAAVEGSALTLVGQLDRKLYERTNKVLEAAGGKWNRKARAHVFDGDASERIEQIILTGDIIIHRDEFEFFPTHPAVVRRVHDLADIYPNQRVLEPSAGHGALVAGLKGLVFVDCIEKMPANAKYLRDLGWLDSVFEADFLEVMPNPTYDRVLMNPPFGRQADIKHVLHALKFLKPGGLLVSVMSASVCFRENKLTADFRNFVAERGGKIEELPEGSFKESGTMVRSVVVVIPN